MDPAAVPCFMIRDPAAGQAFQGVTPAGSLGRGYSKTGNIVKMITIPDNIYSFMRGAEANGKRKHS